jgi:hypothetical protein
MRRRGKIGGEETVIYVTGFLGGGIPCHIPSMTGVMPVGLPLTDFSSVKSWSVISHEMSHGRLQHKKRRKSRKFV